MRAGARCDEKDQIGAADKFIRLLASISADDSDIQRMIFGEASLGARIDDDRYREVMGEVRQYIPTGVRRKTATDEVVKAYGVPAIY